MHILSDEFTIDDKLGRDVYIKGLIEIIRSIKSNGSFTIGIYGPWGTGKTSLLKQLENKLDNSNDIYKRQILTVWFNPWQYVAEKHLIIPFFYNLIAVLNGKNKLKEKMKSFLDKLKEVPLALLYGSELEFKIPFLIKTTLSLSDSIDHFENGINELNKYDSIYYNLINHLHKAIAEINFKIVIFIDDLDRCLPEKAIELLEGLKVLLDLPNIIFVIAVSRDMIEQAVKIRYRSSYLEMSENYFNLMSRQYLDKIIQFGLTLPGGEPEKLVNQIIIPNLKEIEIPSEYAYLIYEVLGDNPRTIKRFLNHISFAKYIANNKINNIIDEYILKINLIAYVFPDLYKILKTKPQLLIRLENIVKEINKKIIEEIEKDIEKLQLSSYSYLVKKTDLPIVDQWLEDDKLESLVKILKIREKEKGFIESSIVLTYVEFVESSFQTETASFIKTPIYNMPICELVENRMVEIPSGSFLMGNKNLGQIEVQIEKSFFIDKYPMTQDIFQEVMGKNKSYFVGDDLPVENVSWLDAIEFCNKLSKICGLKPIYEIKDDEIIINLDNNGYRLPFEKEWEYALIIDSSDFNNKNIDDVAWHVKNSNKQTNGVGQKKPNKYGLFDMVGNVWEWCNDKYSKNYPKDLLLQNKLIMNFFDDHVVRGGSWANFPNEINSNYRLGFNLHIKKNNIGFRIVRS